MKHNVVYLITSIMCLFSLTGMSQEAIIRGTVFNSNHQTIGNVSIWVNEQQYASDNDGNYRITIPSDVKTKIIFSHVSLQNVTLTIQLQADEVFEFNPILEEKVTQIGEVVVDGNLNKKVKGIQTISPSVAQQLVGANAGVENILQLLPGVNNNNELSTQYNVRGGNYDENLIYVNEIEVYKPFLIRSGQQEGLSFINPDLIANINFSAGGFEAKYGDKLSSVLNIAYKSPQQLEGKANLGLLGTNISLGTSSKNKKLSSISGFRYRNNALLVNSKQTESNYKPSFLDAQTYITYRFSDSFTLNGLATASINNYDYEPKTRRTNFGTLTNPRVLNVYYEGGEKDKYSTALGALKGIWFVNNNLTLKGIASVYRTTETENFDILAYYQLGEPDLNNPQNATDNEIEVGAQLQHGSNSLAALIYTFQHKGSLKINHQLLEWGIKFNNEHFKDRLNEFEIIDSAGFLIPTNNSKNIAFTQANAQNNVTTKRISGYLQWSKKSFIGNYEVWYNLGVRAQQWQVNTALQQKSHVVFSPRAQFAIKPNSENDIIYRISAGVYQQPPFYRELRDATGVVHPEVKAQKSYHFVLGNDYDFNLWNRNFKLTTEAYYKNIQDVNPYTLENVRIRYEAQNNATAYAYGLDVRLNGEFVPGTQSWVSFGYLKTEENSNNQGYIARPTDQRLKFAVLFQDYIPSIPNVKLSVNAVYNTGLPGGSPNNTNPYDYQLRLKDYKRADVGIAYVLSKKENNLPEWANKLQEVSVGFEIFNIFDVRNSITNTWVRDAYTKQQYGIPNYMTGRVFNVNMGIKF
ncbi:carboxypeptidase-like regulatory domain-containing protein [Zhouia sp. PK063]|uniref:TonB-dependent receptor n=1 Tax=Zhouia sp. PK063 TaxID=3373602 RepID=UPI00378E3F2A